MSAPAMSSASAAPAAGGGPASSPNIFASIIGRVKDASATVMKQQKPWNEVLDRQALSKPENFGEALTRIKKNAAYFRVNYFLVMLATCAFTFVMHPTSLLVLGLLLASWVYVLFIRTTPIEIGGRELGDREKLLGMGAISFITIFFLTSVGTVFFSALTFSSALILLHGAFREPDNLFVDDVPTEQAPLLSMFVGGATTSMPAGVNAV